MTPSDLKLSPSGDRDAVITRTFQASAAALFDALTDPTQVRRWLLGPPGWSMLVCEIDRRPGGAYRYVWRKADEEGMALAGTYWEVARPHRLVHTERFEPDWTGGETVVVTELTEDAGHTRVQAVITYPTPESRDGALGSGMEAGVAASYDRLEALVRGEAVPA